jgi:hypothetical protein
MPPPFKTALKDSSQSAHTHALPDISILESRPTPESGFDIGSEHAPHGLRELRALNGPVKIRKTHRRGEE